MERQLTHIIALFSLACLALVTTGAAATEPEKCQVDDLVFGMSSALEGPISGLGLSMRAGVKAAFSEANRQGGINGHNLCLISMNDGYEPKQTVSNIRQLIQKDKVLALIGNVGTPTAVVAAPICQQMKTLLYGAYTGAGVLRKTPPDRYVINYRASYAEETEAMVNGLIVYGGLQPHEIAFLTQRDAFGDTGFTGGIQALRRHGLKNESRILHVRYERNTDNVENALATLLLASPAPKAIILVAAYSPCSKFIRLARAYGIKSRLLTVSFVGADLLAKKLGSAGEGVIITQVVYGRRRLNLVLRYKETIADSSGHSTETIRKILEESISDSGLSGLKSEMADLTLLVEQLRSETRIDHLIDLKDNRLLTTLLRLRRVLSLLPPRPDSFKETFESLLTSFETTLLGTDYSIQKNHQTIKTGKDGFYPLVEEHLQLEAERELHRQAVFAAFNKIHEQLRKTNDEVKNSIQIMADMQENSLQHAWHIMLLVSLVMAGVFLAISSRILSAIRGQVQKIQDTNKVLSAQTRELTKNEIILTGKQVQLEYLSRSLLTAQEDERKRIAYELHDELGQSLTALNLQVRSLTRSMGQNPAPILKEKCDRLSQSIKDIIQSVRQLSQDLSPAILDDLGIEAALVNLLTTFEELHDLVIVKNISQVQLITDLNTQRNLYRIIQELLTNISKHANCTIININIQKTGDELLIRVTDNGRGFNPASTGQQNKHRKGMGLSTIAERIRIMRGKLDIDSVPDGGVKVTFTIPLS